MANSGPGATLSPAETLRAAAESTYEVRNSGLSSSLSPPVGSPSNGAPRLTGREREVLAEIALGHTNNEVAELLSIMPTTVKSYLKKIMGKLGTRNRVETLRAARRAGLVS